MQDSLRHILVQEGVNLVKQKASGSLDLVLPDADKEYPIKDGRIISIFQTKATGDGNPNIANFKCYLGGPPIRGYTKLSLEYVEIKNAFTNPLYMVGIYLGQTVGNCITGNSSNMYGGLTGSYSPTFLVPLSNANIGGGIASGSTGSWVAEWEDQRSVSIKDVRTNFFDIVLTDQNGNNLTWDGSTSTYISIQMKVS